MVFIYPAQRAAFALGAAAPETLVLSGRLVVALVSTAVIPLTWLAARRLAPGDNRLAALAVLFVAISKLLVSFGSSELPRPISTVFVVAAFVAVLDPKMLASAAAGVLLGIAAAFRFSELVFIPAALLTLPRDRYWLRAVIVGAAAISTAAAITAASDTLYWGTPFSSIATAVDYTLIAGQSSRGYQPPWESLKTIPSWSTFLVVALAVAGSSRRHPDSWWLWGPFALLSLLPHKEGRYLIPVVPFLSIAAARGFMSAIEWIHRTASATGWRRWTRELFAPVLLLSLLHEAGGWRLPRSNEGVRLAQYIRSSEVAGFAGQDLWRRRTPVSLAPRSADQHHAGGPRRPSRDRGRRRACQVGRTAHQDCPHRWRSNHGLARLRPGGDNWRGEDYVLYVRRNGRMNEKPASR